MVENKTRNALGNQKRQNNRIDNPANKKLKATN